MARNGLKILDSDMHVFEPHDLYLKYMNPKWGDRIPRGKPRERYGQVLFTDAHGGPIQPRKHLRETTRSVGPNGRPIPTQIAAVASPTTGAIEAGAGYAVVEPRYEYALKCNFDSASQVVAMDKEGIDIAVLFRTSPLHCDDDLEPEYANDLCRAWNDWMSDFCKQDPQRMRPSALITLHDVDLAVDETRRAVTQLGATGLSLVPEPANGRHIHDFYYDPLWREAEKLGVPICFHPAGSPNTEQVVRRFKGHPNDAVIMPAFRNPIELMLAVGSFCAGGVLERFPKLRVAFLEGNCAWLPWALYRLDERWEMKKDYTSVPLSMKPSDYFLRQCFISVDVEEDLVGDVIRRIGDNQLVISTDYPHTDSHWPNAVNDFMGIELSDSARKKILWDNCARLYGVN